MSSDTNFQIAIDGPVGAGKSTVAKLLAEKLGFLFVDTGAMYRATALGALRRAQNERLKTKNSQVWQDEETVSELVSELEIELKKPQGKEKDGRQVTVLLNGQDVSWEIRSDEIAEGASIVSQYPVVREVLVLKQQEMADDQSVVMEGRDIGTRVLPKAQLKIYLDAHVDERVKRKQKQLITLGDKATQKTVKMALMKRDKREMNREIDPLRPAKDALVFDTTGLTITQVVDRICREVKRRKKATSD